jgi:3-methyladenine DNA glycosylase AlkD
MKVIKNLLFSMQNESIRKTAVKTINNIPEESIIGVSIPKIRDLAKKIYNESYIDDFLKELPHETFEENVLHGVILPFKYKNIDDLLIALDKFLPYANNWAVTDVIHPKVFKKEPDKVYTWLKTKLKSKDEYVVRFAIVSLLQYFLDDNFKDEELVILAKIKGTYYIDMAVSWFYSFALIKQYDKTIKIIEDRVLDPWIHNKTIQKALESYRITDDKKAYLRSLKYVKKD